MGSNHENNSGRKSRDTLLLKLRKKAIEVLPNRCIHTHSVELILIIKEAVSTVVIAPVCKIDEKRCINISRELKTYALSAS